MCPFLPNSFYILLLLLYLQVSKTFQDVSAAVTYDVLHDAAYRKKWDRMMVEGYELCKVNWTNDISYYQSK